MTESWLNKRKAAKQRMAEATRAEDLYSEVMILHCDYAAALQNPGIGAQICMEAADIISSPDYDVKLVEVKLGEDLKQAFSMGSTQGSTTFYLIVDPRPSPLMTPAQQLVLKQLAFAKAKKSVFLANANSDDQRFFTDVSETLSAYQVRSIGNNYAYNHGGSKLFPCDYEIYDGDTALGIVASYNIKTDLFKFTSPDKVIDGPEHQALCRMLWLMFVERHDHNPYDVRNEMMKVYKESLRLAHEVNRYGADFLANLKKRKLVNDK